jgi:hypothetical protein
MVVDALDPRNGPLPQVELGQLHPGVFADVGEVLIKDRLLRIIRGTEQANMDWSGTLRGRVTDEDGEPLVGVHVWAYYSRRHISRTFEDTTDIRGWYEIRGLVPGEKVELRVNKSGYGFAPVKVVCDGNDFDITMALWRPR